MHPTDKKAMKTLLPICLCSIILAVGALAQSPTVPPPDATTPVPGATVSAVASPSTSPGSTLADQIHRRMDKKMKQHGVHFSFGDDEKGSEIGKTESSSHEDIPTLLIPLLGIIFFSVFGAPVL